MVRREVRVRAASDLALTHPVSADRAKQAERRQEVCTVEDVVDDPLEVVGVVGVLHLPTVGAPQVELVN